MRILFILDEFLPENSGGAANVAFWLAKGLIKSGHEILVLTAAYDLQKTGDLEIEGVKVKVVFTKPFGRLRNWKNLKNRQILKEAENIFAGYRPDIIHIHTFHHRFSYGIIGLAKRYSKAVFLTLHDAQIIYNGKLFPKRRINNLNPAVDYKISWIERLKRDGLAFNPWQRFLINNALKDVDRIFAVSFALRAAVEANGISNIEVIHNGIDAGEWSVIELKENNILFAGRVDEAKGAGVLIKAFDIINSEIPNAKLMIVGDGNFDAGSNQNIKVLPWQSREAMKKFFFETSVVATPSLYLDPFPTVNLEAMAAGKPVIGTCFGGTCEAVADNETGYIVNPYNKKELAAKIIDLLKNTEKSRLFGVNGRVRVEKFFSLENQLQKTLEQYKKFL